MKRAIAIAIALIAAGVVVVVGTGAKSDNGGTYKVRAIFTSAFTVIAGEDVKISGVKVGKIEKLEVTPDNKAAVILDITEPGFQDFRKDASCTIRPQSLIGERFVECTPTQPKAVGDPAAPKLAKITKGDGKGQYLLPDTNTKKPIDLDLVGNIMRMPYRQRLSIIINELGTGLAANGDALRRAVREANPALEETDKVLQILASQNQVLADLAKNGDTVLAPLARDRAKVADFIVKANTTAKASAERRTDIERNIQKFPAALRQLKPTMERLGGLADQMTPVLTDLGAAAPEVNRFIKALGPFSQAGLPALTSLGDAADVGDQALVKSRPLVGDLRTFAGQAKPLVKNLNALLTSLQQTGGIERLMDFIYFQGTATNGYDSIGHYLRAVLVITTCSTYVTKGPQTGCSSKFPPAATAASARAAKAGNAPTIASVKKQIADGRSPYLAAQDAVLHGLSPDAINAAVASEDQQAAKSKGQDTGSHAPSSAQAAPKAKKIGLPTSLLPGATGPTPAPTAGADAVAPAASSATPAGAAPAAGPSDSATTTLLDYLMGG
jgi:phospholipid/cholesterol/gamma-HCH transport system substrate-binding protein